MTEQTPEAGEVGYHRDHSSMQTRPNGRPIKVHRPGDPYRPVFAACSTSILLDDTHPIELASVAAVSRCRRCYPPGTSASEGGPADD